MLPGRGAVGAAPLRVAFGACARQERPQPIWDAIRQHEPNLFIFLGDNVYGDTRDPRILRDQYAMLAAKPEFRRFRQHLPIIATWDDHDYGENNADASYPMKSESKQIFLDFFEEPRNSERRLRPGGIYTSYLVGELGRRLQIILLDTRYHRSAFRRAALPTALFRRLSGRGPFEPSLAGGGSMLGRDQWDWLARQLATPADLRIIGTSTPFISSFTGSETWANLPQERARLMQLIQAARASGVVFISGDIHRGELSAAMGRALQYPLWELTSSGLNRSNMYESFNKNRVGEPYRGHNFGFLEVDWDPPEPTVTFRICDRRGDTTISHTVKLIDLQFADS